MSNYTEDIGRQGVHKCGLVFAELGFIFREQTISDYGIDAIIETRNKDYLSGKMIAVQIKSGDSFFKEKEDDCIVFRGNIKHYNYWLNHSLPVIIVLYNPSTGECIWENVNKQTAQKCQNGWKIKLPCRQSLECSKQELEQLANKQSEYERRLSALVLAKEWMLATEERGEIILEVEEWINKTSGRGKFELKTEDKNGTEKILFQREIFGFGTKDYEIVFHELFPWADINIDEVFYEENMEEEFCQSRCISNKELAAIFGKVGSDLLQYNDEPRKLYPYRNGAGEVDFYRLKLTLNQIGKSFLDLDSFLETGKCYFLDNGIL